MPTAVHRAHYATSPRDHRHTTEPFSPVPSSRHRMLATVAAMAADHQDSRCVMEGGEERRVPSDHHLEIPARVCYSLVLRLQALFHPLARQHDPSTQHTQILLVCRTVHFLRESMNSGPEIADANGMDEGAMLCLGWLEHVQDVSQPRTLLGRSHEIKHSAALSPLMIQAQRRVWP